ncbi:class I SAM-dependent methyltransferase [Chryseobacterium salivictor]|uniref:Ubiquinone biosynthesis O-methyltransferase n=1 Tax=Chryseobacterium salivictor TaxID=2547600 RepID=A0A4P6ZG87_9FLAO|nr:class I SAM-dependent methyltransferase [Chryseobacterium salivictor]QBO58680.1 Ubiquinone biosynthesis O-methyltransferase [Chryseobacterium salivictor]
MENYLDINRKLWNAKVETHLKSDFYFVDEFLKGRTSLNSIELDLLGDVKDKNILHLQCHFGQDSISLSRLGAKVTGIDLSDKSIEAAKKLAQQCETDTQFLVSDVYDLPNVLHQKFDILYATYGTIGWLPDLQKWAEVIAHFLKPGGQLIFVEFHPVVWMYDDDFTFVKHSYFNNEQIIETNQGTYADPRADLMNEEVSWNHSLSEVFTNLSGEDLLLQNFQEYNWSPYPCFRHIEEVEKGKYQIPQFGNRVPLVYSLVAEKK